MIAACIVSEFDRIAEKLRPLSQVAYEKRTGRNVSSLTIGVRALQSIHMALGASITFLVSDYVGFFMSIAHDMIFPMEIMVGADYRFVTMVESIHRRVIGFMKTGAGITEMLRILAGICQGCRLSNPRSMLPNVFVAGILNACVPGTALIGPRGFADAVLLFIMSDDIFGSPEQRGWACKQLYVDSLWLGCKLLEIKIGHDTTKKSKSCVLHADVVRRAQGNRSKLRADVMYEMATDTPLTICAGEGDVAVKLAAAQENNMWAQSLVLLVTLPSSRQGSRSALLLCI
jgi:hypothetical protein